MTWDRAVVLCHTGAGLRAAAWLASRGVAVRMLCTQSFPVALGAPPAVRGPWADVGALCAQRRRYEPSKGIWLRGRWWPSPRRKRDLLAAVGATGPAAWIGAAIDRLGDDEDAPSWVRARLGSAAWEGGLDAFMAQRLGGATRGVPAGVARALLGRGEHEPAWALPVGGAAQVQRWVETILEAGGEALEEVTVEGIELEHGRVAAVETEFGRELLSGPLFTDLAPWQLAEWLKEALPDDVGGPGAQRVEVELAVGAPPPFELAWVLGERPPLVALRAAAPGTVVAELLLPPHHPARHLDDASVAGLARSLVEGMVVVAAGQARVVRSTAPVIDVSTEARWAELAVAYQRTGVVPLGPTGFQLPMSWADELAVLGLVAEGAVVATQRASLLAAGAPQEPWSLVSEA